MIEIRLVVLLAGVGRRKRNESSTEKVLYVKVFIYIFFVVVQKYVTKISHLNQF